MYKIILYKIRKKKKQNRTPKMAQIEKRKWEKEKTF
jgi:hypothetical protein